MIAISPETRRMMLAKGGTVTYTATRTTYTSNTYSGSDTSGTYVVVVVDDGWRAVTVDDVAAIKIKEPAQEQEEPNTDERSVTWERPHRRPATVAARGGLSVPRKAASSWG